MKKAKMKFGKSFTLSLDALTYLDYIQESRGCKISAYIDGLILSAAADDESYQPGRELLMADCGGYDGEEV